MREPINNTFSSFLSLPNSFHSASVDLICFSHLRWNFVYQRPQHLISRAAATRRVFFFEEPLICKGSPTLAVKKSKEGLLVAVPHIPQSILDDEKSKINVMRDMLDELMSTYDINTYLSWYYTPLARKFSKHLKPIVNIYDCMDELSSFKNASKDLIAWERELFSHADIVFTGGQSLYEFKKDFHPNVYAFPSSVDVKHFSKGRLSQPDPDDQAAIAHPRLGYVGVIDERLDIDLIDKVATLRPDWQIVMVGPVVKIDPASLPKHPNIHYLGSKKYEQLPSYLAGWDIAFMPFAHNEATRYISPTKTPEYLAAGRRVISTSIRDVVYPYGESGLVAIADDASAFIEKAEKILADSAHYNTWLARVDSLLSGQSWNQTFHMMWQYIDQIFYNRQPTRMLAGVLGQAAVSRMSQASAVNDIANQGKKGGV
jgi:UDP-galactopyranose mutase